MMEEGNLSLLGGGGGRGASYGSSTVSEDNQGLTSEGSSTYPEESELELGLGLSLGGGLKTKPAAPCGQYARILTAKDFPSMASKSSAAKSPSSSSSSSMTKANLSAGTKRAAYSVSPPRANGGVSGQVVGWPPVRTYRMNSLVNQTKLPSTEEFQSTVETSKSNNGVIDMANSGSHKSNNDVKEKRQLKASLFVKVNMDGIPIGRKVNLKAHSCYETLARTLEDMFRRPTTTVDLTRPTTEEHDAMTEATGQSSKLLDGSSEFVLTYKDKEGDWMLVGDVPWGMFLCSVKRLRIMRKPDANGLGPRFGEMNGRHSKPM